MNRNERLYEGITNIRDELVEQAAKPMARPRPRRGNWLRWGALAAALAVVIGIAGVGLRFAWSGANAEAPAAGGDMAAPGGGAVAGSTESAGFLSYAGPVLSLSLAEAAPDITAERTVTWDFLPWEDPTVVDPEYVHSSDVLVTDETVLTNSGAEDRTVTVLYPFISSLRELDREQPALTLNDEIMETELYAGDWSGDFTGAGAEDDGRWNLSDFNTWEQYRDLLTDGCYRADALTAETDLSNVPVVVYKFTEHTAPANTDAAAPTLGIYFELDYDATTVLSYGFNGAMWDPEGGWMIRDYFVPEPGDRDHESARYLIVLGEDIRNTSVQGYRTGATEAGNELAGVSARVVRYESDLASALSDIQRDHSAAQLPQASASGDGEAWLREGTRASALHYEAVCRLLQDYGVLSDDPAERYDTGRLDDVLWEAGTMTRVMYLTAEVTVPAGESVAVTAALVKNASYDFYGSGSDRVGLCGYDVATTPDGLLDYTGMTLRVINGETVEITDQNCGLTLADGTAEAAVDQSGGLYYMVAARRGE